MAMNAKGTVEMRAKVSSFSSEKGAMWRMRLCGTPCRAQEATSEVDMDAATIPSRPHRRGTPGGRW